MFRNKFKYLASISAPDDKQLYIIRRDFSGGINTRQHASKISDTQAVSLTNFDIGTTAQTQKQKGITLVQDLSTDAGMGAFGFEPRGGTNELLVIHGTNLEGWTGSGVFTKHDTGFTTTLPTTMVKATCSGTNGDVVLISNGTDNVHQMLQSHAVSDLANDNTACPLTTVLTFYRNRVWALKSNILYWSAALPATYLAQFDRTTNNYNITVGTERAILGLRDLGIICFGEDAVYGINPAVTPAATDKPEKMLDIGCVAGNTVVQVADDVFFLSSDGVRGVFRTQQDKLQMGQSFPLSYPLKEEFDTISWAYISKACAIYFDNKYLLALPVNSSTYNNQVWVYYPASGAWTVINGWNVGAWATVKISGEERLYYIDSNDGVVYRAFYGNNNNGTAITSTFIGREEDVEQPLVYKNGGELEIEAEVAGSGNTFAIYVSVDGGNYQSLGTVNLALASAPVLPVTLPFTLADSYAVRTKFHFDNLGKWKTLQVKIENTDSNTDPIILYSYTIVTFQEEYENE